MQYDAFFYCFYITIKAFSTDPVCCRLCQTEVPCYLACSGSRIKLGESSVSTNSSEDQEIKKKKKDTENVCWPLKCSDFSVACVTQSERCFHFGHLVSVAINLKAICGWIFQMCPQLQSDNVGCFCCIFGPEKSDKLR